MTRISLFGGGWISCWYTCTFFRLLDFFLFSFFFFFLLTLDSIKKQLPGGGFAVASTALPSRSAGAGRSMSEFRQKRAEQAPGGDHSHPSSFAELGLCAPHRIATRHQGHQSTPVARQRVLVRQQQRRPFPGSSSRLRDYGVSTKPQSKLTRCRHSCDLAIWWRWWCW